jgi:hypothetical protein
MEENPYQSPSIPVEREMQDVALATVAEPAPKLWRGVLYSISGWAVLIGVLLAFCQGHGTWYMWIAALAALYTAYDGSRIITKWCKSD